MKASRKEHWEKIYNSKEMDDVGWYQQIPETSLYFVDKIKLPFDAKIIDIGGGAYFFVDHLLNLAYEDITVLDISEAALQKAKERLGDRADKVKWLVADITEFEPDEKYDLWHDRAVFHFLTEDIDTQKYIKVLSENIATNGHFVLGTFSVDGPKKCSGLDIVQYSKESVKSKFSPTFDVVESFRIDHTTPFGNKQNFLFSHFKVRK